VNAALQHLLSASGLLRAGGAALRDRRPLNVGPIPRGLCGPGLLAHAITAKFADHVPVHRLAGQLARSGVIAASTLGDWLFGASELLRPLDDPMHTRLLNSRVIHGDDTGVRLRVAGSNHTTKAHLWVCIGDVDCRGCSHWARSRPPSSCGTGSRIAGC
jgi:hypothetical protein